MKIVYYVARLTLVFIVVALVSLGLATVFHQTAQLSVLLTLLCIAFGTERLWSLFTWLGSLVGVVDIKERVLVQERLIEYELVRAQRYGAQLVMAAILEKRRTPLHMVAQKFRETDIVLRTRGGHLLVVMPDTTIQQASHALQRLTTAFPIKDVIVADERMLKFAVKLKSTDEDGAIKIFTSAELRKICTQALDKKCNELDKQNTHSPAIYPLYDQDAARMHNILTQTIQL